MSKAGALRPARSPAFPTGTWGYWARDHGSWCTFPPVGYRIRSLLGTCALPALVALVAAAPCFTFPYLWDDYQFLGNALAFRLADYLPSPHDAFYRPLSRGVYFQLLGMLGDTGAYVGHVLNALLLLAAVALLALLVRRLAGNRAAVFSGLIFALLAPTPFLVGWISGDQDLLGMVFILAALHLQLSGRTALAIAATALSLLSKETAAALVPALVGLDWILGRKPYRLARRPLAYGALAVGWISIHTGIKVLLQHGLRSGAIGYVGAGQSEQWPPYVGRYLLTLLNVPTTAIAPEWIGQRGLAFMGVAIAAALVFWTQTRETDFTAETGLPPLRRVLALGALFMFPPLLLTTTLVRGWAPYYAVYPALGLSMLLGVALARVPVRWAGVGLAAYLVLGICSRAGLYQPNRQTEYNLSVTGAALRRVQAGFKTLHPSIANGTQILVAVQAGGLTGVYTHLYYFQALRVWYREPGLQTMRPDWRRPMPGRELLFWVSPDLGVFEIDLENYAPRTTGPAPDRTEYQKTLRYYARGLAASGETDRGLKILLYMRGRDYADIVLDRRYAAMLLFHEGRDREAEEMLKHVPPVTRANALDIVAATLANPGGPHPWDDDALRAFGLEVNDPSVWRDLMRRSDDPIRVRDAIRFAERLLRLEPGDPDAVSTVRRLSRYWDIVPIAVPAPPD